MPNLTNSMNLLAKHQAEQKRAEQALKREYTYDNHLRAEAARERVRAQRDNILAKITPSPALP